MRWALIAKIPKVMWAQLDICYRFEPELVASNSTLTSCSFYEPVVGADDPNEGASWVAAGTAPVSHPTNSELDNKFLGRKSRTVTHHRLTSRLNS